MNDAITPDSSDDMISVLSIDGTRISFKRIGSGPALVLIHGVGDVRNTWDFAGASNIFAEHSSVYTVERRGRGNSSDSYDYSLELEVEDIVSVVKAIDEPVDLLGHSYGAICAMEAALKLENLRSLILYEPPFQTDEHVLRVEDELDEMDVLLDDGDNEQALIVFMRDIAEHSTDQIELARSTPLWPEMVAAVHTVPRELRAISGIKFDASRYTELTLPTLLISGSESIPPFQAATKAVNDALPNSRVATLEGQGHAAMLTGTQVFTDKVLSFISTE